MSDELVEAFRQRRAQYQAFTSSITSLLECLLEDKGVSVFSIESRTKELDSFSGKVSRDDKADRYKNIEDVTDLSGVRIISYLQEDCALIGGLLRDAFTIDEPNSVVKADEMDADKFGYLSDHYVVSITPERAVLPEFARFRGMKAEIQVRTVLQHTWAAIDHKLRYKSEADIPREIRRRLFRISALLESADDEFSFLNERVKELRERYSTEIGRGKLAIPLNTDSAVALLEKSDIIDEIIDIVAGSDRFSDDLEFPNEKVVLKAASELNINTVEELVTRAKVGLKELREKWPELESAYRSSRKRATRVSMLRLAAILGTEGPQRDKMLRGGDNLQANVFRRAGKGGL